MENKVIINIEEAIRYMGYRSEPAPYERRLINECAKRLAAQITPASVCRAFPIERTDDGIRVVGTELVLRGSSAASHLMGCESCLLICATAGSRADELIRAEQAEDITRGFMTDCLASAAVEGICNELEALLAERLKAQGKFITWRFSPGYGDLPLDIQPDIIRVLDADKRAGVSCTESLLLTPRKSVTAVIGISSRPIEKKRISCLACAMHDNCSYRKAGGHCGI